VTHWHAELHDASLDEELQRGEAEGSEGQMTLGISRAHDIGSEQTRARIHRNVKVLAAGRRVRQRRLRAFGRRMRVRDSGGNTRWHDLL
jgi:hypothetical protein